MSLDVGMEAALASGVEVEVLVPGDVEGLSVVARTLRSHATVLEDGAGSLARVECSSWRGEASTAFTDTISVEPARWLTAADAFQAGAGALEGYAAALSPARDKAALAAATYRRYRVLIAQATAAGAVAPAALVDTGSGSVPDRMATGATLAQLQQLDSTQHELAVTADGLRRRAIDLLTSARAAVEQAAHLAACALDQAAATAPEARRFWEATIRAAAMVGAGHTALDAAGLLPVLGAVPDAVNAAWYGASGDQADALLSAAGMLPLLGDGLIGGRIVRGGVEAADAMAQRALRRLDDGGLAAHELPPAFHALTRHSGKSDAFLFDRVTSPNALKQASTYVNNAEAERYTYAALEAHGTDVDAWLRGTQDSSLKLTTHFDHSVGKTMFRADLGTIHDVFSNVVRLRRDASMPNGYRVVTSYPG